MRVKLYPAGDGAGKDTHISIYFQIMKGPYDGLLSWPFKHKVTFKILDQKRVANIIDAFRPDPYSSSYRRPWNTPNPSSGFPLFCTLEELNSHGYLREDTMYIQVDVDKD